MPMLDAVFVGKIYLPEVSTGPVPPGSGGGQPPTVMPPIYYPPGRRNGAIIQLILLPQVDHLRLLAGRRPAIIRRIPLRREVRRRASGVRQVLGRLHRSTSRRQAGAGSIRRTRLSSRCLLAHRVRRSTRSSFHRLLRAVQRENLR